MAVFKEKQYVLIQFLVKNIFKKTYLTLIVCQTNYNPKGSTLPLTISGHNLTAIAPTNTTFFQRNLCGRSICWIVPNLFRNVKKHAFLWKMLTISENLLLSPHQEANQVTKNILRMKKFKKHFKISKENCTVLFFQTAWHQFEKVAI